MNKTDVLALINGVMPTEELIAEITKCKIEEFVVAREALFARLNSLLEEYFPREIVDLLKEYQTATRKTLIVDNLWVDYHRKGVRVSLNPNYYVATHMISDGYFADPPTSLDGLKRAMKLYDEYLALETSLKKNISDVYKVLCDWKTSKCVSRLEELNNLTFGEPTKPEKFKIRIIIEKEM